MELRKNTMKSHAKEYLLEFANNQHDNWLKALVYETIQTNGEISEERKKEIYLSLKDSTGINFMKPELVTRSNEDSIRITKLIHKCGVNAIEKNQVIKFSNDVTVLYGMNGTGKSGYFKILNELVGGNQKKDILSNIYLDTKENIDVEICYTKNRRNIETINWIGNTRSLPNLNKCKVFDTSYLNGLLNVRTSDVTLIEPLGLSLFAYLISLIDGFKEELENTANSERMKKPNIDLMYLSDTVQSVFKSHNFSEKQKKEIEKLYCFSPEDEDKLKSIEQEIKDLIQINIQDKIKLISNQKNEIDGLKRNFTSKYQLLISIDQALKDKLTEYKEKYEANNKAKEQFDVLKKIPSNDTKEWKDFIIAGMQYSKKINDSQTVCPYCLQSLKENNAIKIIQSYGLFLKDNSQQELNKATADLDTVKTNLQQLFPEIVIPENVIEILSGISIGEESLKDKIVCLNKTFTQTIVKLQEKLTKKKYDQIIEIPEATLVVNELSRINLGIQSDIDIFSKEESEKQDRVTLLKRQRNDLLEKRSISCQKNEIDKWFTITLEEKELLKKASSLKTKQLSILSTTAHNELVTETLKYKFNEEFHAIGYPNLSVKIESAGTRKGISSTKLVLEKNSELTTVLSEGEQKAVALALFIAEIRLQNNKNPIILDDPVNSLDHKIAGKFAERLLSLDNQVILFNHNRLFLDAFETAKDHHVCKNIDSGCNTTRGKHIVIYDVISQGKNSKGVLRNHKTNFGKTHLEEAKRLLGKTPFEEETKVSNLIRLTVECLIDEVVFNRQIPTKYSNKNSRIAWDELKRINNDSAMIDSLKIIHGRCSGGEMHNGSEKEENPIDVDEFKQMVADLEVILN